VVLMEKHIIMNVKQNVKKIKTFTKGECPQQQTQVCICPAIHNPVCGSDSKTYENDCVAKCEKITTYTKGSCSKPTKKNKFFKKKQNQKQIL